MATNAIEGRSGKLAEVDADGNVAVSVQRSSALNAVTSIVSILNSVVGTLLSATVGRRSLLIQPRGAPILVRFENAAPGGNDLRIENGEKFVLPFAYEGVAKASAVGADAEVVVIEGVEP